MAGCLTCVLAKWDRTANGRLHPNGRGQCTFVPTVGPLPPYAQDVRQVIERYRDHGYSIWREEGQYEGCEAHKPATGEG